MAIPIFENRTFTRGLEYDLTEAVIKQVEQRTPYVATRAGVADTLLEGRVTSVQTRELSQTRDAGLPQEVEVLVTIDFTWTDQRRGDVLVQRRGFSGVGRYVPTAPVNQPFEVGQHEAVQRLARDLVSTFRGGW
ncbi:MAG: LPS assembly lipoprotein LptE [Planctomycetota bacterium]